MDNSHALGVFLPAKPKGKGRHRCAKGGHAYTPQTTRVAEEELVELLKEDWSGKTLLGAVSLELTWIFKATKRNRQGKWHVCKPDIDNTLKLVMDAGTKAGLWKDDSQVAYVTMAKRVTESPGEVGVHLDVWEL